MSPQPRSARNLHQPSSALRIPFQSSSTLTSPNQPLIPISPQPQSTQPSPTLINSHRSASAPITSQQASLTLSNPYQRFPVRINPYQPSSARSTHQPSTLITPQSSPTLIHSDQSSSTLTNPHQPSSTLNTLHPSKPTSPQPLSTLINPNQPLPTLMNPQPSTLLPYTPINPQPL